ncbi:MAG: protein NO VEIN domain-containing protein [Promethearchaeota archaeon]
MELSENEKNKLEDCRILRLENGSLRSISDTEIFFPIAGGNKYGFESELSILKKEILDPEEGSEKEIKNFLKDLGVKDVNALEIVDNHILPIYGMGDEEKKWKNKDDETLLGYVQYIKDNIEEYEEKYKEKKNPLEKIKENLVVRISTEDEKTHYRKPNEIYLPKIYGNENNLEVLFEDVEVDYVDEIYIKNILKEANSKNKEEKLKKWKKFFQKIGVNEVPKIVYYEEKCDEYESHTNCQFQDKLNIPEEDREDVPERYWKGRHGRHKVEDWKPSEEFEKILSDLSMRKGKILFRIIRDYWNQKYSKYDQMKYTWYYRTSNSKKLPSSFIRILKNKLKVPTTEGTLASPDELFLNDSKIKSLLGDTVKYIDGKIENDDLIENLEINTDADPKNVLEYAKKQVKKGCTDKEKFKNLYEFLNNHFDDENTDFSMKKEFRDNHLILVPETEKKYFKLQEVIWEDVSDVFKDNKIYLEKHFEELENFFVNKLDVNRKPLPEDYANTLVTISEKDEISEQDRETIVEIYEELDYNLDPNKVAETIDKKDWWDDFIEKEIFLTNKNEFWANDGNVFIKNDSQLFELFSKNDDIAFLWLPKGYHQDKIKSFINKCDIGYISENCKLTPMIGDTSTDKNEELTDYIQNIIPFVFRYLYWKEHSRYEKLKEKKELEKLPLIEVYIADDLKVKYKVNYKPNPWNSIYKITKKTCVLDGNKLYISQDPESTTFDIPIEISKIFGEIKGLEDFLLLLNEVEDHYKREEIMDARDIKILPSKERKYLFEKDSKTSDEKSKSEFESEISESDMESEVIDSDSDDSPVSAEQQTKRRKGREKPDHPIYDPDDLVLDGQTITIKAEPDEKTRDQVSETDTSSSGSFGDSFEGSQSHLKKIDRLGMWVTRQYELNRVEKNYECKNPEDYVFDIHNEELYSEAKADDIAGPVLNELEEKGLPELYPGFDVLVVNPKSNEADRLIELKSSRTNTRTLEITWNEWKTARDPGFRDLYYLYNVGNLGKDSRSIPYIKEIPNPFQLLNAKTKEKKEVKKTVKININNFKREGEIKKTKLTIADRNN